MFLHDSLNRLEAGVMCEAVLSSYHDANSLGVAQDLAITYHYHILPPTMVASLVLARLLRTEGRGWQMDMATSNRCSVNFIPIVCTPEDKTYLLRSGANPVVLCTCVRARTVVARKAPSTDGKWLHGRYLAACLRSTTARGPTPHWRSETWTADTTRERFEHR